MSTLTIIPAASEKAYASSLEKTYIFNVPMNANKQQIIEAVEAQYGVVVKDVRTLIQNGKSISVTKSRRSRPITVKRKDTKKAYVSLKEGTIQLFEEPKEEETK